MDFSNRSTQQTQSTHSGTPLGTSTPTRPAGKDSKRRFDSKWWRVGAVALLFCITVLIAAVVALLAIGGPSENKFVNDSKYQAVFLTNGQVYFGHIKDINSSYIDLTNIYYLQSSSSDTSAASPSTANNNVTLIKLGCELHKPYDQMLINVSQVSFWENIQSDGQVGAGIAKLPKCTQATGTTSQSNTTPTNTNTTKP